MTKQKFFTRVLLGLGLVLVSLGGLAAGVAAFFFAARVTKRLAGLILAGAAGLALWTGALAWLLAGGLGAQRGPFAALYTAVIWLLCAALAYRYLFRSAPSTQPAPTPRPDTQYWDLSTGSRIAYTHFPAAGPRQAAPLVYLHGGPATPSRALYYELLCELTQDGYDIYLFDQVGSGQSGRLADLRDYTLERNVADLEAIRVQLGAPRLVLAGTSWGAVLAAHYLAAHPTQVEKMILISPGILGSRKNMPYDYKRTASSDDPSVIVPPLRMLFAGMLARINPAAALAFASQAEMGKIFDSFTSGTALEYQANCKGYRPDPTHPSRSGGGNYYANLMILMSLRKAPDPRPVLQGNPTPALILRGACDYIPLEATRRYLDSLPNASLREIEGAGHALASAQPAALLAAMRAFLTGAPLE